MIFTAHQRPDTAQEFYRDIKSRARGLGRDPAHVLVMPGVSPFVGRTEADARAKYDRLTSLILAEDGIALLNGLTGGTLDLTGHDLDGPLPPAPPTEGMKSRHAQIRQIADENYFSICKLYQWVASARGHFTVIGTPRNYRRYPARMVRERSRRWLQHPAAVAADGFDRFCRSGDPRPATSWAVPHRLRGQDPARKPWLAGPDQPLGCDPSGACGGVSHDLQSLDPPLRGPVQVPSGAALPRRRATAARRLVARYGLLLAFLLLWQTASSLAWVNPTIFPPLDAIVGALWNALADGSLLDDSAISLQRAGIALVAAVGLGIPLGLLMGQIPVVERALGPILQLFRQTSALHPVFILLLLGLGETSKVFVIFWATLFPILLATIGSVKAVDRKLLEMARSFGAGQLAVFGRVILPAALPAIFVGLRLSACPCRPPPHSCC